MEDVVVINRPGEQDEHEDEGVLGRGVLDDGHDGQENRHEQHEPGYEGRHPVGPRRLGLGVSHDEQGHHGQAVERPDEETGELDELDHVAEDQAEEGQQALERHRRRRGHALEVHPAEETGHVALAARHVAESAESIMRVMDCDIGVFDLFWIFFQQIFHPYSYKK